MHQPRRTRAAFPRLPDPLPGFAMRAALLLAALGAGLLDASGPSLAGSPPSVKIVSGPKCVKGEPATDQASTYSQGVSFTARPLSVEEWEGRLERRAPGHGKLFRGHDGAPAPLQVFLVKVENRGRELVRFQPGNVLRLGGPNEEDHILDYTDLYRYLQGIGKAGEDLDPVRDEFYDTGMILESGKPVERLLFFHAMPPSKKRKAMSLLFSSYQVGAETYRAALAWHFEKVK